MPHFKNVQKTFVFSDFLRKNREKAEKTAVIPGITAAFSKTAETGETLL
ncbi:hypothetical protein [uncultured Dysosmobacter sp.]|nr:hypothetical protein [uncultured Dysosmobacter sp.]